MSLPSSWPAVGSRQYPGPGLRWTSWTGSRGNLPDQDFVKVFSRTGLQPRWFPGAVCETQTPSYSSRGCAEVTSTVRKLRQMDWSWRYAGVTHSGRIQPSGRVSGPTHCGSSSRVGSLQFWPSISAEACTPCSILNAAPEVDRASRAVQGLLHCMRTCPNWPFSWWVSWWRTPWAALLLHIMPATHWPALSTNAVSTIILVSTSIPDCPHPVQACSLLTQVTLHQTATASIRSTRVTQAAVCSEDPLRIILRVAHIVIIPSAPGGDGGGRKRRYISTFTPSHLALSTCTS